ncbi:MAG: hypothetical protein ACJ702_07795, partial [Nitrososphaeraceae archaeon]
VAKLIAWGRDFEEARIRTRNALIEFSIDGINTTIPLHKTIIEEQNFIKGDLSTDYLERFNLMDKMHENAKDRVEKISSAAVASMLLQSQYVKKGTTTGHGIMANPADVRQRWNRRDIGGRAINAI